MKNSTTFDRIGYSMAVGTGQLVHRWFSGYRLHQGMVHCCAWCWPYGSIEMLLPTSLLSLPRSHGICDYHKWLLEFTTYLELGIEKGEHLC